MNTPNGTAPTPRKLLTVSHAAPHGEPGRTASGTNLIKSGPVLAASSAKRGKHRAQNIDDAPVTVAELLERFKAAARSAARDVAVA